jgi:RNA polymerase sigma-70 factor (ECF subfamily)
MTKPINDPAFRQELLAENDRWLRMSLYARLRNRHDVEEVMQEVAVAVMRKGDSLRDVDKAGPWLHQIAIRQALLFRRKCGRQSALTARYFELCK